MCGIAGVVNFNYNNLEAVKKSLFHRGPDSQNIEIFNNVALIHTRLSIVDLSDSIQPMSIGNYILIFNGEIYNHLELRKSHLAGEKFLTTGDTETLLKLFIKFKEKALDLIDGMFAFAILDKRDKKIFLARDRAGKKPLYYFNDKNSFIFASEIDAIKQITSLQKDQNNLANFLRIGYFPANTTAYKDLFNFPAGAFAWYDENSNDLLVEKYFNIENVYKQKVSISQNEALEILDLKLKKSVKRRLLSSDVEVGAFLSGGIDSSLVVAMASEFTQKLKTFTVKFKGQYDESPLAEITAKRYNTEHKTIQIDMNLKHDIEKILLSYSQPFWDSSAIPSWYVSKEAKNYVSVVLNGDGADEIFAGYRRYVPIANDWIKTVSYFSFLKSFMPLPKDKQDLYSHIYRLINLSSKKDPTEFYLSLTTDLFEDFQNNIKTSDLTIFKKSLQVDDKNLSNLDACMIKDFNNILYSDLLPKIDIATMTHSLEGRSPFLSKDILEFAPTLPNSFKIREKTTKYLLRELSKKYLDQSIVNQPKRGFEIPLNSWVNSDLKGIINEYIFHGQTIYDLVDKKFIINLVDNKIKIPQEKRAKILWSLFVTEVWSRDN